MPEPPDAISEPLTNPVSTTVSKPVDRQRWFEVFLVLAVALLRPLVNSIYILSHGASAMPQITNLRWSFGVIEEVVALLLLGYVLSRRKLSFKDLGLRWSIKDVGVGLLLGFGSYISYLFGSILLNRFIMAMFGHPLKAPSGSQFFGYPGIVAVPYLLFSPFFEEMIVRAYLMTEIVE